MIGPRRFRNEVLSIRSCTMSYVNRNLNRVPSNKMCQSMSKGNYTNVENIVLFKAASLQNVNQKEVFVSRLFSNEVNQLKRPS